MAPLLASEPTSFTLDNMGRFLCNTLQEATDSAGEVVGGQTRSFDTVIIGGGTFGCVVAEHLFATDTTRSRRILVLEAGPFVLTEHVQNLPFMGGEPAHRREGHERLYLRPASHGTPQAAPRWPESRRQQYRLQLCPVARTPR